MRLRGTAAVLAIGLLAAGCGTAAGSPSATVTGRSTADIILGTGYVRVADSALGEILVTAKGFTLYHLTTDRRDSSTCRSSCVKLWPPLLARKGVSFAGVAGLSTFKRPDGRLQVAYRGMPLYAYSADSQPGETSGEGVLGTWFVVKYGASRRKSKATTAATQKSSGGGYGY